MVRKKSKSVRFYEMKPSREWIYTKALSLEHQSRGQNSKVQSYDSRTNNSISHQTIMMAFPSEDTFADDLSICQVH
jgi:hypothetical protein